MAIAQCIGGDRRGSSSHYVVAIKKNPRQLLPLKIFVRNVPVEYCGIHCSQIFVFIIFAYLQTMSAMTIYC
jgi:hypothetical protein